MSKKPIVRQTYKVTFNVKVAGKGRDNQYHYYVGADDGELAVECARAAHLMKNAHEDKHITLRSLVPTEETIYIIPD